LCYTQPLTEIDWLLEKSKKKPGIPRNGKERALKKKGGDFRNHGESEPNTPEPPRASGEASIKTFILEK